MFKHKFVPMTGFEPEGVGSINRATTTAQMHQNLASLCFRAANFIVLVPATK